MKSSSNKNSFIEESASQNKYIRTDLASETLSGSDQSRNSTSKHSLHDSDNHDGYIYREKELGFAKLSSLEILDKNGSDKFQRPIGRYITISFKKIWLLSDEEKNSITALISSELKALCERSAPDYKNILIAGLGNRSITADAIGPQSADNIIVTRHLSAGELTLITSSPSGKNISAISPGVIGQTGIETAELIAGAVKYVKPQIVICIDALAARSVDRLASTVQLSDTGIAPGSGVKNNRLSIDKKLLGIPVIAIGVPTVVDSSTLVYDALEKAGITDLSSELLSVLENGRSFFVSLKETDIAAKELSDLISNSINLAFTV